MNRHRKSSGDGVDSPARNGPTAGRRLPPVAALVGVLALGGAYLLGAGREGSLAVAYLVAFLFVLSIALGALGFVLIQHVTRAGWSVVVRRQAEHVMGTLPLFLLLFVPVALALRTLYPWASTETMEDPLLAQKRIYLNPLFFHLRSLGILLLWGGAAWWFRRTSLAQDRGGSVRGARRLRASSAPVLVLFGLSLTVASFDWIMSLDPLWYSTIFGVYFFSGAMVGGLAFLVVWLVLLQSAGALTDTVGVEHYHDLGKLLFGFICFWAYIAFSQFLLIWYANIPQETAWYADRLRDGWKGAAILLAVGHFTLPFFFLLPRGTKRSRGTLAAASLWILAMHYLDLLWLVGPSQGGWEELSPGLHLVTLCGVGALFLSLVGHLALHHPPIPVGDPRLEESLAPDWW